MKHTFQQCAVKQNVANEHCLNYSKHEQIVKPITVAAHEMSSSTGVMVSNLTGGMDA